MQILTYSRLLEDRLIEKYKKDFFSKTGKILSVDDYQPVGLPFPIIGLYDLQRICESFLPEDHFDLKEKTRLPNVVYPRLIFCHMAYNMSYSIKKIAEFIERDRTTVYSAIASIDNLMSTNYLEVVDLYNKIVNQIKYESTISSVCRTPDLTEPAVLDTLF